MAGTTTQRNPDSVIGGTTHSTTHNHNVLVDDLETLRAAFATLVAKLNADAGVTDTNYAAPAAAALLAARVGDGQGLAL